MHAYLSYVVKVADVCYRFSCNRAACANHANLHRFWHYLLEERTQRHGVVALSVKQSNNRCDYNSLITGKYTTLFSTYL